MAFLFVDSLLRRTKSRFLQISIKALEMLFLSTGLISTILMVKGAVTPYSCEIVFSSLVGFWNSIKCFLSSYVHIFINFIVMLIVISTTFHHHETDNQDHDVDHGYDIQDLEYSIVTPPPPPPPPPPRDVVGVSPPPSAPPMPSLSRDVARVSPPPLTPPMPSPPRDVAGVSPPPSAPPMPSPPRDFVGVSPPPSAPPILSSSTKVSTKSSTISSTQSHGSDHDDSPHIWPKIATLSTASSSFFNEPLISKSHEIKKTTYPLNSTKDLSEPTKEKHKVTTKTLNPHLPRKGKESDLSHDKQKNEEEDSMEATWKAIIGGGKQKPKKKQLKKSETWDVVPPRRSVGAVRRLDSEEIVPSSPKWRELRKSETFNDAVSMTLRGGLIRRDPSTSLKEFNQKVDAFIKKINDSMRLQRQESIRGY